MSEVAKMAGRPRTKYRYRWCPCRQCRRWNDRGWARHVDRQRGKREAEEQIR